MAEEYDTQTSLPRCFWFKTFLQDSGVPDRQVKRKRTKYRKCRWLVPNTKLGATFVTFVVLCLSVALVTHTLVKSHWTHCKGIKIVCKLKENLWNSAWSKLNIPISWNYFQRFLRTFPIFPTVKPLSSLPENSAKTILDSPNYLPKEKTPKQLTDGAKRSFRDPLTDRNFKETWQLPSSAKRVSEAQCAASKSWSDTHGPCARWISSHISHINIWFKN